MNPESFRSSWLFTFLQLFLPFGALVVVGMSMEHRITRAEVKLSQLENTVLALESTAGKIEHNIDRLEVVAGDVARMVTVVEAQKEKQRGKLGNAQSPHDNR